MKITFWLGILTNFPSIIKRLKTQKVDGQLKILSDFNIRRTKKEVSKFRLPLTVY